MRQGSPSEIRYTLSISTRRMVRSHRQGMSALRVGTGRNLGGGCLGTRSLIIGKGLALPDF